ncbi:MAG: hypothetical protein H0V01_13095 [Bacteroidetes bacterium]|nr:hypothetical protein [Bacteroidota bacterium]HET6245004.1 hypothetical protein [Bacteroidia bacterium]
MENERAILNFINKQPFKEDYLWRYVDLKKFLSFLIDKKLHLKRLDHFEDKDDGIFGNLLLLKHKFGDKKKLNKIIVDTEEFKLRELQKKLFASCWFVGNRESMAMWKLFSNPDSVAVRIKYKDLKNLFKNNNYSCNGHNIESITLGKVQYYDYQKTRRNSILYKTESLFAFSKDESFSNEREFRIVVKTKPESKESSNGIDLILTHFITLPFEIVFHPKAENWGVKNLSDIMNKFNIPFKKYHSELNLRNRID